MVVSAFMCAFLAVNFVLPRHETQAVTLPHCAQRIYAENLTHTPPVAMNNKRLTSSVFYNGNGVNCLLDSVSNFRVELPRMTRVSDIGVHLNGKIDVRLVRDVNSNETFHFDCPTSNFTENDFSYFRCLTSKGKPDSRGIMASAIELAATFGSVLFSLQPNETWMYTIQKRYDDHPVYGEQCLAPGKYLVQTFTNVKSVYKFGETVTYECQVDQCPFSSCNGQRTCGPQGWSGRPPFCMNGKGYLHGIMTREEIITKDEMSYHFNHTFIQVTSVTVHFSCLPPLCTNEHLNNSPWVEIALEHVVPEAEVKWVSARNFTHAQAVFTPKTSPGNLVSCKDCAVKVKFDDNTRRQRWSVSSVYIEGYTRNEFETYAWMIDGCPPIDPYIGMPDDFAGEASRISSVLNENLLKNPCREGYWHNRTEQYEQNPKQCTGNSWQGEIPQCILTTCRTPPRIENGSWRYRGNVLFHEVVYSCEEPLVLCGNEIARCNYALNKWEGVPKCVESRIRSSSSSTAPETNIWIVISVAVSVAVLIALIIVVLYISLRKKRDFSYVEPKAREADKHLGDDEWSESFYSSAEPKRVTTKTDARSLLAEKHNSLRYQEIELEHCYRTPPQTSTPLNVVKLDDPLYEIPDS